MGVLILSSPRTTSHVNFAKSSGYDFLNTDGVDKEHNPIISEVTSYIALHIRYKISFFTSGVATTALVMVGMSPKASCLPYLSKLEVSFTTLEGEFGY